MTEVRKAFKCLQDFSLCSQLQDGVVDDITALQNQQNNVILCHVQQKKLTDFFSLNNCSSHSEHTKYARIFTYLLYYLLKIANYFCNKFQI